MSDMELHEHTHLCSVKGCWNSTAFERLLYRNYYVCKYHHKILHENDDNAIGETVQQQDAPELFYPH